MLTQFVICEFLFSITYASFENTINVGTVLFSPSDIKRTRWSTAELGLLKARRYFQELLPPPNFIDTKTEAYVDTLLKYFRDTYTTIKRVAHNEESDSILTTAFSDAIGGYLNLWVLPITKLAFYGGTVSQSKVAKLFNFHNELKSFLGCDANGWRSPNKNLLQSITVNINPPRHITRSMNDACNQLAYFEKRNSQLNIPTPYINWGDKSSMMFVPLKNYSLIPLDSVKYQNVLSNFYDTAKNCLEMDANDPTQLDQFDNRFQDWLANDVVPHLTDENVYLALGNVLSLVNSSYPIFPMTSFQKNLVIAGIPIDLTSKKIMFIIIIIILEIAWCIPVLSYLACKKKKRKPTIDKILEKLKQLKSNHKCKKGSEIFQGMSKQESQDQEDIEVPGPKIQRKPRDSNFYRERHNEPKTTMATNTTISVQREREAKRSPLKSSLKKERTVHKTHSQQTAISIKISKPKSSCNSSHMCTCSKCSLVESLNKKESMQSMGITPIVQYRPVTFDENIRSLNEISNTTPVKVSSDDIIGKNPPIKSSETVPVNITEDCPCLSCTENETDSQVTIITQEVKKEICEGNFHVDRHRSYSVVKENIFKHVGLRLESGRPDFEIMIEKPQTEISVGIRGIFDPLKGRKSKIPKRLPKTVNVEMTRVSPRKETQKRDDGRKSLIPKPKSASNRKALDDLALKNVKNLEAEDSKLNRTL